MGRRVSVPLLMLLGVLGAGLVSSCFSSSKTASPTTTTAPAGSAARPNIVFVLTDDLSSNLVKYMPHVVQMEKNGATFSNYFVTDSLCCPSRTSIFTGEFPHNSGVFRNAGRDGGYATFSAKGDTRRTYALALQRGGYDTALMGKYLNGYLPQMKDATSKPLVPAGWSEWDVAGSGYGGFDYDLNENHAIVHYGSKPTDYLTDVVSELGTSFIDKAAKARHPFAIEVATFAPHGPSTPAPRDRGRFRKLQAPRTPAFDRADTVGNPRWLQPYKALTAQAIAKINTDFRKRVQSVQAVDQMIGRLEQEIEAKGLTKSTYFVFSSDNGFHMGEHRMLPGKLTAFDTDIRVPLVIVGPGVPRGHTITQLAENIDLAPTFEQLAGVTVPPNVDGTSLVPLLRNQRVASWRKGVLVEHHGPDMNRIDPDFQPVANGNPPSYEALRQQSSVYVEYFDGEHEYYDTATDPNELRNLYATLSPATQASLHNQLTALKLCHGGVACQRAELLQPKA